MSKIKEAMMLLLSSSSDEELALMLHEECWSEGGKACILEEIERRKQK